MRWEGEQRVVGDNGFCRPSDDESFRLEAIILFLGIDDIRV